MNPQELLKLRRSAISIRKKFLRMHFDNLAGHIGTGLSSIELLTYLYGGWLKPDDRFILSKGHGASALYAVLHHAGLLSDEDIATYYKDGTLLPAHPAPGAWKAIHAATGSLGHGLSIGTGMAYSRKHLSGSGARVVCLLSDGECNEGAVWEAALFAHHHKLGNLTAIVDANGLQGFGRTRDVLDPEPFAKKWEAFGFDTFEVNGHQFEEIDWAMNAPRSDRPVCVLARTVKGKGVRIMEDRLEWHYLSMKREHIDQAIADLETEEKGLR